MISTSPIKRRSKTAGAIKTRSKGTLSLFSIIHSFLPPSSPLRSAVSSVTHWLSIFCCYLSPPKIQHTPTKTKPLRFGWRLDQQLTPGRVKRKAQDFRGLGSKIIHTAPIRSRMLKSFNNPLRNARVSDARPFRASPPYQDSQVIQGLTMWLDASVSKASDPSNIFKSTKIYDKDPLPRSFNLISLSCPFTTRPWMECVSSFLRFLVTQLIIIAAVYHPKGTYMRKNLIQLLVFADVSAQSTAHHQGDPLPCRDRMGRLIIIDNAAVDKHEEDDDDPASKDTRLRIVVCMSPSASRRLLQSGKYLQSDIAFKRIADLLEFEMACMDRDANTSLVFCRVFINRQSAVAHQKVFEAIDDIWRHLHAVDLDNFDDMVLEWGADQHRGQAKGTLAAIREKGGKAGRGKSSESAAVLSMKLTISSEVQAHNALGRIGKDLRTNGRFEGCNFVKAGGSDADQFFFFDDAHRTTFMSEREDS
ncbi:hypothetical protein B0H19DRAFT_1242925 [Mycena capillaripes]|nr:hypothetical protein B0H19DRAFT_1242925 [Mycena capillaripes]